MDLNSLQPPPVPTESIEGPCDRRLHARVYRGLTVLPQATELHHHIVTQDLVGGGRVFACDGCGRITYESSKVINPRG